MNDAPVLEDGWWTALRPPPGENGRFATPTEPAPPVEPDSPEDAEAAREAKAERDRAAQLAQAVTWERHKRQARRQVEAEEAADPPEAESRKVRLTKASTFKIKAVRWVWQGRMPLGEITLIPGREGVGKSTFLAWQAAQLTRGDLPGMWYGTKRAVLYAATEDSWEHTIAPRMLAAGADMDLVYRIDVEVFEGRFGKLNLPVDVRLLTSAAREVEAAALMCDPVISVLSDQVNTFKAQELRGALEPLRQAAEDAGMAVAGLVHFNKGKDNDVLTAVSGSRAWTEVARAVIAIAKDPDAEQYTCVVSQVKNNLGRMDVPHMAYTIASTVVETDGGGAAEVGRLAWTSEAYGKGVEDLLNPPKERKKAEIFTDLIGWIGERQIETGALVPVAEVTTRWGGRYAPSAIRQALTRAKQDGLLRSPARGLYGLPEGDNTSTVRRCPSCSDPLLPGENFCGACRRQADADDRRLPSGDVLF